MTAFTTYLARNGSNLGSSTANEIEQARKMYDQLPETYLANTFPSEARYGAWVFVDGPFARLAEAERDAQACRARGAFTAASVYDRKIARMLGKNEDPWTVDDVVALCRGFGLREFKTLIEFERFDPTAKYLRVGCERHAECFFFDPEQRITVIPCSQHSLTLSSLSLGTTLLHRPSEAVEWLLSKYAPNQLNHASRPARTSFRGTSPEARRFWDFLDANEAYVKEIKK
jgi:hypothetical protein